MIDIPQLAPLNIVQWIFITLHMIIAIVVIVYLVHLYIKEHGGFIPSSTSNSHQHEYCITKREKNYLFIGVFALVHMSFLTTYLFGFDVGLVLEIDLLLLGIYLIMNFKKNSFVPYISFAFLVFSFITIDGPFNLLALS